MKPGATGGALQRRGVVATAAALLLVLCLPPVAFAASVEASPVVTVAGSQVEGTVTIVGVPSIAIASSSIGALASAISVDSTVTLGAGYDQVRDEWYYVGLFLVFSLGLIEAFILTGGLR